MRQRTTLQVERPILAALRRRGTKGQTYTDILRDLLRRAEWQDSIERSVEKARDRSNLVYTDKV